MRKILIFFILAKNVFALTLDEAINIALQNHPYLKESKSYLKSTYYDYKSKIGNFFPSLSLDFSYTKYQNDLDYFTRNRSFQLYWNIYNSGINITSLFMSKEAFLSNKESYKEDKLDIIQSVKNAYYNAVAKAEIYKIRKIQLKVAQKDMELAKKKLKLGLVTKSDFLQAKVRLERIRYTLVSAEFDYKKALANLNSLLGYPLDKKLKLDFEVLKNVEDENIPAFETLKKIAFGKRPVIKEYKHEIKKTKWQAKEGILGYTPSVYIHFSANHDYNSEYGSDNYNTFTLGISWNFFEGLKKYHLYLEAKEIERAKKYSLKELKRKMELRLFELYMDLKSAYKNLEVSKTLLKEANQNYKQALGEYKVGKGDIISLLTAESSLADAHETFINSLLDIALKKSSLEREMGVNKLPGGGSN